MKDFSDLAVVVLAAGSSSRLGKPKQLLHYQQETLIKRVVKTALQITAENVFVVTGFLHEELIDELKEQPVKFIQNKSWKEGMGSSIQTGISAILKSEKADKINAVLFLLSDQPLINFDHLDKLIQQFYLDKNSTIAATAYAETQGVPAVFDRSLFPEIQQLSGSGGAGSLFKKYHQNLTTVLFEQAAIDIDTEADYLHLIQAEKINSPKNS
ncbi:MAG: nucleotidyltransferase family protein [Sphingobacteriaceae bacterium]|nr:MAG: nucleotidyltransferase family protein [Sphingobacteriaceae bacterium]